MLEALRRSVEDLVARIRRPEPLLSGDTDGEGSVAGQAMVDGASVTGTPAVGAVRQRRTTGYLPPVHGGDHPAPLATAASEHPTANLPGADPLTKPSEREMGKVVGAEVGGSLMAALVRIGPTAFPFKTLIIGRLQALPGLTGKLGEAVAARDYARTAALALALQESCAILADDLVHQAAHVTKEASKLEKAVKSRDKTEARDAAQRLQLQIEEFDAAVDGKRNAAFLAGEKLARFAVAKNYSGVSDTAPGLARDAAIIAFLENQVFPFLGGEVDLAGSLTDRTLRLQQALIKRDWAMASRLGREMSVQAAIMADTTVKLAVQLIIQARAVRDVTVKVAAAGPASGGRLGDIMAKLTQAVPALTSRLDERLSELPAQAGELTTAIAHKDYNAVVSLTTRMAVSAQVAQHGIVAKAASLLTVTSALEDAAKSGDAEIIIALLEGV